MISGCQQLLRKEGGDVLEVPIDAWRQPCGYTTYFRAVVSAASNKTLSVSDGFLNCETVDVPLDALVTTAKGLHSVVCVY